MMSSACSGSRTLDYGILPLYMPMTTSASCSMAPDSRRSGEHGPLFCLCSFAARELAQAEQGDAQLFAIIFIIRLMSDTAWVRLSLGLAVAASCRLHELQVVHH